MMNKLVETTLAFQAYCGPEKKDVEVFFLLCEKKLLEDLEICSACLDACGYIA